MNSVCLLRTTSSCFGQFAKCRIMIGMCTYQRTVWSKFRRRSEAAFSTETATSVARSLVGPHPSDLPKVYDAKLTMIVDQISKLNLIEVAELNELLKKTLNIPDTPMMTMASAMPQAPAEDEEEEQVSKTKTSFTVKLLKFDETKKVQLIKEMKNQIEGMNLVQAKKFVETTPQVVRADIGKDEAEKIVASLQAVGGTCEIV